jgi:hypothetical protein
MPLNRPDIAARSAKPSSHTSPSSHAQRGRETAVCLPAPSDRETALIIGRGFGLLFPSIERAYWRANHDSRPYRQAGLTYEDYQPAYEYGWRYYTTIGDQTPFERMELEMQRGWDRVKGASRLAWDQARSACKDAWDRVQLITHGKAGGPGTPT